IYNNSGYGVHVYNSYAGKTANANLVRKNKVWGNGLALPSNAAGILLSSGTGNIAYDNLVWGNPVGIRVAYNATNSQVLNNTVYANTASSGQIGIWVSSGPSGTFVKNNISYQNGTNLLDQGTSSVFAGNLTTDPLFVNAAANNFDLQGGSPAIDAGVTLSGVPDDYRGTPRPQGVSYDIGASEYVQVQTPAAPSNLLMGLSQ